MAADDNRNIIGRFLDRTLPVRELIGRYVIGNAQATLYKSRARVKTYDETRPDYEFWDKLRRCKASGYSLSGLYCKRIENIFATWVLGQGVEIALAESGDPDSETDPRNYTDDVIATMLDDNADTLLDVFRDKLGLGDQYIIVNADGTLSIPSPDTVEPVWDLADYRRLVSVTVTTKTGDETITDEYRDDVRTVTVKRGAEVLSQVVFENLIGRIPVVHVANARSANETYGHPIHEELRPLYDQYDDLVFKQLDGAKLLGNPLLTFFGMEDIQSVINANDPTEDDTYTDKDGNTDTRYQLNIDQNAVLLIGKGGDAKFVGPTVGFTEDTKTALKSLFLLIIDHTGIPEFIWGGERPGGLGSPATPQMDQWVRDIKGRQADNAGWLRDLVEIWLAMGALVDPQIVVEALSVEWPEVLPEDIKTLLDKLAFAKDHDLITDKTALTLLDIVPDPGKEVQEATAEADARREKMFPDGTTFGFQQDIGEAQRQDQAAGGQQNG